MTGEPVGRHAWEDVMSVGVGALGSAGSAPVFVKPTQQPRAAGVPDAQLPSAEERAFEVATINQRLASLAAARTGQVVDLFA
jgi:hypothetical protein